jgi:phosphatidylserine/phosphatidylglycerophosphate/cardiolipin synthase-like enzyme
MTRWASPVPVSTDSNSAEKSQIVTDESGNATVVWIEKASILASDCDEGVCSEPVSLSRAESLSCAEADSKPENVTLAVDDNGNFLVVWQVENGALVYTSWSAPETPAEIPAGCIPTNGDVVGSPRLEAADNGKFVLVYRSGNSDAGEISIVNYANGNWAATESIGFGDSPSVYVDTSGRTHAAWCGSDGQITYWIEGSSEPVADLPCLSRPELAEDSSGNVHIAWYGNEVQNNAGQVSAAQILYESVRGESGWEVPSITAVVENMIQPAMHEAGGDLHLAWVGKSGLSYASQIQYDCQEFELPAIGQVVFDIARLPKYRPVDDVVPYCRNQYDRLIFTPNPDPAYSEEPISVNGGFDRLAELAEAAEYEVLFSNMWYDADASGDSPGRVLADSVATLYTKLSENPDQYPRGMTVRILLGNPPEVARGEFAGQIWHVLTDLRNAGVPEMRNEELGWSVEVANFEGALPHSHIKSMIVDGKTAVAAGFNMSYEHFEADHPSGMGNDRFDLGIQVTGPVAQESRRMFDDLWEGANRMHCRDFFPNLMPWQSTCAPNRATSTHAPEVLKYYLTTGDSAAFSMYRTEAHDEADQQVIAALSSAEASIDVIHVNFTMEMVCDLNLLYDQVCTTDQVLPYMDAILDATENNGVHSRILIKGAPIDGVESGVHLIALGQELDRRGIAEQVEVRLFDGPMHPKTALIDNELLIVGSQNYHYSAFGEGSGLAEYSLGVIDPQASTDFQRLFEYQWQRGEPVN